MMMPSLFTENLFDDFFNDFDEDFFGKKNPLYGKHARNMMKTDVRETDTTYEVDVFRSICTCFTFTAACC